MDNPAPFRPTASAGEAGGISANTLKLIAILAMLCDHIALLFVPPYTALWVGMHLVGRITGPVMFFFVAEGYRHTRSANRYTLRLALFAALSYLPYLYMETGSLLPDAYSWLNFNVIYTILVGLLAVRVRHELANPYLKVILILLLGLLSIPGDWGLIGFTMIFAFDFFHDSFTEQAVAYTFIVLFQHGTLNTLLYPLTTYLAIGQWVPLDPQSGMTLLIDLGMFLPLLLLRRYHGRRGRGGRLAKWGFYLFYPAHMLLLGWIYERLYW